MKNKAEFDQTIATYRHPRGAAAFLAKELRVEQQRNAHVYALLDALQLRGLSVLDLGCGFGREVAACWARGARAIGVDVSPNLLAEARRRYGEEGFYEADFLSIEHPPEGNTFDVILAFAVLVHVPHIDLASVMQRWVSWLSPHGRLVLIFKHGQGHKVYTNLGDDLPRVMVFYTEHDIRQALPDCDVVLERHRQIEGGDLMVEMILQKRT